jgi:hypothetical protein
MDGSNAYQSSSGFSQMQAPSQHMGYQYSMTMRSSTSTDYDSDSSTDSITIVPTQRSYHDGYNRSKTPSGQVAMTASGQTIELFAGTHQGVLRDACGSRVHLAH